MNKLITIAFFIFLIPSLKAQEPKYFVKQYGWEYQHHGYDMLKVNDGYLIIADQIHPNDVSAKKWHGYVLKVNNKGDTLWTRTFYEPNHSVHFYKADTTLDGNFIATGFARDTATNKYDIYLVKIDTTGSKIWSKIIGDSIYNTDPRNIKSTFDKGFLIASSIYSDTTEFDTTCCYSELYLVKTDSAGNMMWNKTYHYMFNNELGTIHETKDSTYMISGYINFNPGTTGDIIIMEVDKYGNILRNKIFDFTGLDGPGPRGLLPTYDNGFMICGLTNFEDGLVFKIDSGLNLKWKQTFYGNKYKYFNQIIETKNKNYITVGYSNQANPVVSKVYFVKLDSLGNTLWEREKMIGGLDEGGLFICEAKDGGYLIGGYVYINSVQSNVFLMKTNCLGFIAPPVIKILTHNEPDSTSVQINFTTSNVGHYYWDFGDTNYLEFDLFTQYDTAFFEHTYNDTGYYVVTLIASACGESDTLTDTIHIESFVGIKELTDIKKLNIYPNPNTGMFNIELQLVKQQDISLYLYNIAGQLVFSESNINYTGSFHKQINLNRQGRGVYHLQIVTDNEVINKRVVYE